MLKRYFLILIEWIIFNCDAFPILIYLLFILTVFFRWNYLLFLLSFLQSVFIKILLWIWIEYSYISICYQYVWALGLLHIGVILNLIIFLKILIMILIDYLIALVVILGIKIINLWVIKNIFITFLNVAIKLVTSKHTSINLFLFQFFILFCFDHSAVIVWIFVYYFQTYC